MNTNQPTIKLSDLKPNEANPRYITDELFEKLCKSITDFPRMMEIRPIVVDEKGLILGGNMGYKALIHLNYVEVPSEYVKVVKGLKAKEKDQFIAKDNIGFGDWDWDILANEWDAAELEEWGLKIPKLKKVEFEASQEDGKVKHECPNCGHKF